MYFEMNEVIGLNLNITFKISFIPGRFSQPRPQPVL